MTKAREVLVRIDEALGGTATETLYFTPQTPVQKVSDELLAMSLARYPGVKNLKVKSDGKEMWTYVPGKDKVYSLLNLSTFKVMHLGE